MATIEDFSSYYLSWCLILSAYRKENIQSLMISNFTKTKNKIPFLDELIARKICLYFRFTKYISFSRIQGYLESVALSSGAQLHPNNYK